MQSASHATYVSSKIVNAYAKKKQQREQRKNQSEQVISAKKDMAQVQIDYQNMEHISEKDSASEEDERNRSLESISSDELDGNLNLSCDEDEAENQRIFVQQRKAERKKPARKFK